MNEWIAKNAPWLSFVLMAVVGGIVAHVREWEVTHPGQSIRWHLLSMVRRSVMAALAGLLWFYITLGQGWQNSPFAYAMASIVGLFAPEFFDMLWSIGKKFFKNQAGGVRDDHGKKE